MKSEADAIDGAALFKIWFWLGVQSFGGGVATFALIRRAVVERHAWMSGAEFDRHWALCQMAPGNNLIGLTILVGRRLGGPRAVLLCLLGLLLPSVCLTAVLTACYAAVRDRPEVTAALRGVVPAAVGLGLYTSFQMLVPLLKESRAKGGLDLTASCLVLAWGGVLVMAWRVPVPFVLLGAGALLACTNAMASKRGTA